MLLPETVLAAGHAAWDSTAMSGTSKRVTEWCKLDELVASISFQVPWTNGANVLGAFEVEESNDGVTPIAAGIVSPTVNNNSSTALITRNVGAKYARLAYTNTSGTGTLGDVIANGKRGKITAEQTVMLTDHDTRIDDLEDDAFTPDTAGDWDSPPTTRAAALDELAARVKALEP